MQRIRLYQLGIVVWIAIWLLPWQAWMGGDIWLKLGLSLVILILPGACLYDLLAKDEPSAIDSLVFGFTLSHLVLALMGTAGRALHVSFSWVANAFMGLGILLLAINSSIGRYRDVRYHPAKVDFQKLVAWLPLALAALVAALMTIQRVISGDDLAYLAYITHWQHLPALDFKDVYFGADQLTMTRMWLVSAPFSQAFLSRMSGLHGILILTGYYEPFLAVLGCLAAYRLARALGFSERAASFSVVAQIVFLALLSDYLHPGSPFFHQLSTDKASAAFIFAPAFVQSLVACCRKPGFFSILLSFLVGLSLSLMHPVIAAFSILIGGGMVLFSLRRADFKWILIYGLLGALVLSPYVILRFAATDLQPQIPYDSLSIDLADGIENMITTWGQGLFYGFNLSVLEIPSTILGGPSFAQAVIGKGWMIIPVLSAVLALFRLRTGFAPRYILSAFLLCFLAGFPLTGWMLGRIFSAWMLERSTWLFPYGIAATGLLLGVRHAAPVARLLDAPKLKAGGKSGLHFTGLSLWLLWVSSILILLRVMQIQGLPDFERLSNTTKRYQQLASIGRYMDGAFTGPEIVAASDELNDFLPALSWKAKVISYRPSDPYYPYFQTATRRSELLAGRRAIFSEQTSLAERLALIYSLEVKMLVVQADEYDIFKSMLQSRPLEFTVKHLGRYYLITKN